jgi:hypothetical protein
MGMGQNCLKILPIWPYQGNVMRESMILGSASIALLIYIGEMMPNPRRFLS